MKKRAIISLFLILLCVFSLSVFAKGNVELNVDKNSVDLGDEITVSINFDKENQEANTYTAKLSYDEDVFESIDTENFEEQDSWSDINYNSYNKEFKLTSKSEDDGQKLVKLKLKVKDEAKQGKTSISISNATATKGGSNNALEGSSAEVQVGSSSATSQTSTNNETTQNNSNDAISANKEKSTFNYLASRGVEKTTDLTALRYIMQNPTITYKSYKLGRYKELEDQYRNNPTKYINAQQIYEDFLKAMQEDAASGKRGLTKIIEVKKNYFLQIKKATNDLEQDPFSGSAEPVNTIEMPTVVSTEELNKETNAMKDVTKSKNNNEKTENKNTSINTTNSNVTSNTSNETTDKKETEEKNSNNTTSN